VGSRIVVADDSDTILQMILITLRRAGYEPETATDGGEALDAVRKHRPELLIVDATMPVCDGYEVVRALHEELGDEGPYVIMLTASDRLVDRERATEAGVDEFMSKPFSPGALRDRVREILEPA
jgi:DNA-binding response OmpR family regulator